MKRTLLTLALLLNGCRTPERGIDQLSMVTTNRVYGDIVFGPEDVASNRTWYGEEVWRGNRVVEKRGIDDGVMILQTIYTNERFGRIDQVLLRRDEGGMMETVSVTRISVDSITKEGIRRREEKLGRELHRKWGW